MNKRSVRIFALVWAGLMIAVLSSTATLLLTGRLSSREQPDHFVTESEYETIQRYQRLDEIRERLLRDYYQPLDEDSLLLGAIHGMTESIGDPYTFYYTPEEMKRSDEDNAGLYHGIGVLVQASQDGYIQVLRVYPDTPAEAAGLRVGDLIVAVDGEPISGEDGRTYNDAVNMIRGEDGTSVRLTILRDGETMDVDALRADVNVSFASWQLLEGDIGYISLTQFTGDAADRFQQALDDLRAQGAKGLVVDVRNNPGGLLDQVVKIADSLLPQGLIVYIEERDGTRLDYYSDEAMVDVPLVVLVNDMSASASEILAASVQALGRGEVIGLTTYGKGIVQTLVSFDPDGAGLQLTTSSYYDANGRSIHGVGVTPDVEVALEGDSIPLDPDPKSDNQLAVAIEEIEKMIRDN